MGPTHRISRLALISRLRKDLKQRIKDELGLCTKEVEAALGLEDIDMDAPSFCL